LVFSRFVRILISLVAQQNLMTNAAVGELSYFALSDLATVNQNQTTLLHWRPLL
jgi:hypothetical protein